MAVLAQQQLRHELEQYAKIEERRRAEESAKHKAALEEQRKRDEEWKKQIHDLVMKQHEEKLASAKAKNRLLHALSMLIGAVAAGGGVYITEAKSNDTRPQSVASVAPDDFKEIERRVGVAERKIERLKDMLLQQQNLLLDSTTWLGQKIDAAHPRKSEDIRQPAALEEALRRRRTSVTTAKPSVITTDPFDGIE